MKPFISFSCGLAQSLFVELLVDPGEEALEHRFRLFLSACQLGLSRQAVVTNLLFDLVESGDRVQCLVGFRRLDIPGVKDFTAGVCPALRVRDPRILRVLRIGAVAVALQDGAIRSLPDAGILQLDVLAVQRLVVREFVDDHAGNILSALNSPTFSTSLIGNNRKSRSKSHPPARFS